MAKLALAAHRTPGEDFETFFEELPCAVLVLGEELRLVSFNRAAFDHMYEGTEEVLRTFVGDVIGCVHAAEPPAGCGTSPACRVCVLRRAAENTLRTGQRTCVTAPMTIRKGDSICDVLFLVATARASCDEEKIVLVTIQDLSDVRGLTLDAHCTYRPDTGVRLSGAI